MVTVDKIGGQVVTNCAELRGLHKDEKPTNGMPNGSVFYEIDTGEVFMFDEENQTWISQAFE